jgi:hypothetical protein
MFELSSPPPTNNSMTSQDLATYAPLVQAAVSLVGFGFVLWQLIELRHNVQGATQDRLYAHYGEICKLFLEKPHLRPYFYDNEAKPVTCPVDRPSLNDEIDGMSEMILGLIEHAIVQHGNLPTDSWSNCWLPYAIERVKKSQTIREFYQKNKLWYARALRKQVEDILAGAGK